MNVLHECERKRKSTLSGIIVNICAAAALLRNENLGDRKERQQRFPWGKEKYRFRKKTNYEVICGLYDLG